MKLRLRIPKIHFKNTAKLLTGLKPRLVGLVSGCQENLTTIVLLVAVFGTIYLTAQQVVREAANDPQVQLAEDLVPNLSGGMDPASLLGGQKTELGASLAPFLIVYDGAGKVLTSSVELAGSVPVVPQGGLDVAKKAGVNKLTWEPKKGVRLAIVVNYFKSPTSEGYIVVGRSLREVDKISLLLLKLVAVAGLTTVAATLALRKFTCKNCC